MVSRLLVLSSATVIVSSAVLAGNMEGGLSQKKPAIRTAEEAVHKAMAYTGFDRSQGD